MSGVRVRALMLAAPIALLFLATANAYAAQFSFNPSTGEPYGQIDFRMPGAIIAIVSVAGVFLIIRERRKARGIWFSDSEPLK
jgi:hypothetical protein